MLPLALLSDDSVETPIGQTLLTGAHRRPPSLLPWVLFGVTAGILAALSIVLIRQISLERQRADEQAQGNANATARAEKAELAVEQMKTQVSPLEEQVKKLTAERDELDARNRSLTLEAAKATGAPAPTRTAAPAKAPAKKKPVKKKKKR